MDQAKTSVSSSRDGAPEETGMEQVMSDLQALKRLYGLLHRGPADENLDETSRDLLMKMLDDATQQTLLKQAKMLSGSLMSPVLERKLSIRSDRRTRDAEPPLTLRPLVSPSPSPSIPPGERSSRLNQQYSTVSSRAGGHFDGHRQTAEEPLLARLASYRSSRTAVSALTPRHRPSGEQRNSGLSLYRLPVAATSQHGTVTGSNRHADRRDRTRQSSGRGDLSMYISRSNSSSGAAVSYPSTSPTASLESSASASYSPPPVSRRGIAPPLSLHGFAPAPPVSLRGIAPPVYAPRVSRSMRRRRRQEILERRVGRLRMLKNKIDMVFHHRHDHHHHLGRGLEGPSSRLIPGEHHRKSPWRHLGEMFHRTKRQDKEITSRTVVGGAPAKRRGGGGNMHALFDAMRRHLRGKRRTPASVKMRGAANRSRVQAKKMHWWQRLRKRRGRKDVTAGIPRRRLGL
uniref:Uncharacterized protein n=1 Tax=Setaria italica TaxID=4555 RepID=K3YCW9_SETIT